MENKCKYICQNCQRFGGTIKEPCVIDHITLNSIKYPELNISDCVWYEPKLEPIPYIGNIEEENKAELNFIDKNKDNIDKMENFEPHVEELPRINIVNKETGKTLTDEEYEEWKKSLSEKMNIVDYYRKKIFDFYGLKISKDGKVIDKDIETSEDMLIGDTEINHFEQVTPWKRALNAARRTVGKEPLSKDPSPTWEAKILLAEHSPIRLIEYDFGWKKIRQWVTAHMVRHHEGCEKFVHSQRSDRRELPCDRDHIYQGAKNDMDMTCNAQAMMNISRKRLCSCASKETREAWKQVMDELQKIDPILRNKCVPECVYRGFCPELKSCGFFKTEEFKKQLAEYRRTKYGKDRKFYVINNDNIHLIVENTGHIYTYPEQYQLILKEGYIDIDTFNNIKTTNCIYIKEKWKTGYELCIDKPIIPICVLVWKYFKEDKKDIDEIYHIDGNIYNNDIDNLTDKK